MNVFGIVKKLERELHDPDIRSDVEKVGALLHPLFVECGRSGRIYSRTEMLEELSGEESELTIWSQDFDAREIMEGLVLLTYLSAHINTAGVLSRHSFRSSLWQQTPEGWQLHFHQGTPIQAFTVETSTNGDQIEQ